MKHTKKFLALILACIMVISMIPMTAVTVGAVDEESNAISTVEDFMNMTEGGIYYLTNDIDFSKVSTDWEGDSSAYTFDTDGDLVVSSLVSDAWYGMLNGNGHAIYGFELEYTAEEGSTESANVGVFASLTQNDSILMTTVSNLSIGTAASPVNATVDAKAENVSFGFLAGYSALGDDRQMTVDGIEVYGVATISADGEGNVAAGGVIGSGDCINVSNSTVTGSLTVMGTATVAYIGGTVGHMAQTQVAAIDDCVNNAEIDASDLIAEAVYVGGIIGEVDGQPITVTGCVNNGAIDAGNGTVGGIIGYATTCSLLVIADCANLPLATETPTFDIYGVTSDITRLCVVGCKNGAGNAAKNTPTYAEKTNYQNKYSYIIPISSPEDFDKIGDTTNYPDYAIDGFYCITAPIDFNGTERTTAIIEEFNGVLYGGGNTVKGINFVTNATVGFITYAAKANDTAIINLSVETSFTISSPAKSSAFGGLAAFAGKTSYSTAGSTNTNYTTIAENVNVTTNITTGSKDLTNIGGMFGVARYFACIDCDVYGNMAIGSRNDTHFGGFLAWAQGGTKDTKSYFLDCNNYANIELTEVATTTVKKRYFYGGFLGRNNGSNTMAFINCNNFGDIKSPAQPSTGSTGDFGAFVGTNVPGNGCIFNNCSNFGNVNGCEAAVLIARYAGDSNPGISKAVNIQNYGTISATGDGITANNKFVCTVEAATDLTLVNVFDDTAIATKTSASVRFNAEETGIRFKSDISEAALVKLQDIFGEDCVVSYGTLITPEIFANGAGDTTFAALDKYADDNEEIFGNSKAYVDVPATTWFVENDVEIEGLIAGSILGVNDNNLNAEKFNGRGYIRVSDANGAELLTIYSATVASKSVEEIAQAAYNDVLYKDGNGDVFKYNAETQEYDAYNGADVDDYAVEVGTEGSYTKYSCYTEGQYLCLKDILGIS